MKTEFNYETDMMKKAPKYDEVAEKYTYRYDYNDEYDIIVTQSSFGAKDKYELAKKSNLNIKMTLDCDNIDYDEKYVYLYQNESIPFFNVSNKEQGWFSSYGKKNTMSGKAQILEFFDDKILIRNYNDNTIYFIDSEGEILSDIYKDIYICQDRYIVKNKNDKYMVIDKDFNKVFDEEFDIIDPSLNSYGLYICADTEKVVSFNDFNYAKIKWKLLNYNGETIMDDIEQIAENYYQISTDKSIAYVTRYEQFLENIKDIEFNFVGDRFYRVYQEEN